MSPLKGSTGSVPPRPFRQPVVLGRGIADCRAQAGPRGAARPAGQVVEEGTHVARWVEERIEHQGWEPEHGGQHDRRHDDGGPPQGLPGPTARQPHPDEGPAADHHDRDRVAHVGLHEEDRDEGESEQVLRPAARHQPALEHEQGEEGDRDIGVPDDQQDRAPGADVGERHDGRPGCLAPESTGDVGEPGQPHDRGGLQQRPANQRGPRRPTEHGGHRGQQVEEDRPRMAPAEPAVGADQRRVAGEGPDVADPEVDGGLVLDRQVRMPPALDQDGHDRGQGHQGERDPGGRRGPRRQPGSVGARGALRSGDAGGRVGVDADRPPVARAHGGQAIPGPGTHPVFAPLPHRQGFRQSARSLTSTGTSGDPATPSPRAPLALLPQQ